MEIKLLQYLFGLKPLIEFHSAFFQSNNCFSVRILTLLYLEDTKASQFRGQATMMPFWASCSIMYSDKKDLRYLTTNLIDHSCGLFI